MSQTDLMIYGMAALAFIAIIGIGFVLTDDNSTGNAKKRAKLVGQGQGTSVSTKGAKTQDASSQRRKETQKMLSKLREDDAKRRKSLVPQDIKTKLEQAGLTASPVMFYIVSLVLGVLFAAGAYASGAEGVTGFGYDFKSRPVVIIGAGLGGFIGFPRWVLGFLAKKRAAKMTSQFADGIDIIVRGVKSGLPLNECLRIIAKESPDPLGPEFAALTDNVSMGVDLERALQTLYKRVPLSEINFFVIVLTIQAKAGGNLSEALGNLSNVIRSRRMMREKVKAMSSEAKASAGIIGVLPFAVGTMVFMTTPAYVLELFTTETGHFLLFVAFCLYATGITIMRKMINFDM